MFNVAFVVCNDHKGDDTSASLDAKELALDIKFEARAMNALSPKPEICPERADCHACRLQAGNNYFAEVFCRVLHEDTN